MNYPCFGREKFSVSNDEVYLFKVKSLPSYHQDSNVQANEILEDIWIGKLFKIVVLNSINNAIKVKKKMKTCE